MRRKKELKKKVEFIPYEKGKLESFNDRYNRHMEKLLKEEAHVRAMRSKSNIEREGELLNINVSMADDDGSAAKLPMITSMRTQEVKQAMHDFTQDKINAKRGRSTMNQKFLSANTSMESRPYLKSPTAAVSIEEKGQSLVSPIRESKFLSLKLPQQRKESNLETEESTSGKYSQHQHTKFFGNKKNTFDKILRYIHLLHQR